MLRSIRVQSIRSSAGHCSLLLTAGSKLLGEMQAQKETAKKKKKKVAEKEPSHPPFICITDSYMNAIRTTHKLHRRLIAEAIFTEMELVKRKIESKHTHMYKKERKKERLLLSTYRIRAGSSSNRYWPWSCWTTADRNHGRHRRWTTTAHHQRACKQDKQPNKHKLIVRVTISRIHKCASSSRHLCNSQLLLSGSE